MKSHPLRNTALCITFALLTATLLACSTLNVPAPQTFNQKVLAAYGGADALVQSTTTLLAGGKLKPSDAQNVHDQAVNLKAGIDIAQEVHATDPVAGEDRLTATITALTALQTYLQSRQHP